MSSQVQLKLLTLLNVSATKRPLDVDLPGGARSSRRSLTGSPAPVNGSQNVKEKERENSSSAADDGEGPANKKPKKKGISWGGEIGPSGSGSIAQKSSKNKQSETPANGVAKASSSRKRGSETVPSKGLTGVIAAKDQAGDVSEDRIDMALEVDEESDIEADDDQADRFAEGSSMRGKTFDKATKEQLADDAFNTHFAVEPSILTPEAQARAEAAEWNGRKKQVKGLGRVIQYDVEGSKSDKAKSKARVTPQLLETFNSQHRHPHQALAASLDIMSTYTDFYANGMDGDADGRGAGGFGPETEAVRAGAMMHAVNHVLKTRRRIVKNNERLAHGSSDVESRDQAFVRPKVLLLLPTRSMALHLLENHVFPLAPLGTQMENRKPFVSSFGLPDDVTDPLTEPGARSKYPADHIAAFRGNSDDNFRFGLKFTRKAWRVIMPPASQDKLIDCDIIIASPLAIRMAADKEGGTDVLSSIEILFADGLDTMAMQNWEHVQFVFSGLNKIPNDPHGCDFSRVKPWYLDQQARFLRQSIMISRYDTPEIRALFNKGLYNLEGKVRLDRNDQLRGTLDLVKAGVKQIFERLPGNDPLEELDVRFKYFTENTIPLLLKSAMSRTNTLLVIPSYFDFIRVVNYLRKTDRLSFAAISEYSSNEEISAARTAFFKGKKAFLIVTERFHFYRRYKLRGAKTVVFYSLPDHAIFYSELLASPFLPSATGKQTIQVDPEDVTARVLFSKWDYLKLARVVGSVDAKRLVQEVGETKFTFV